MDPKIREAVFPLVEQLAATAYALGRRDERRAATEEADKSELHKSVQELIATLEAGVKCESR